MLLRRLIRYRMSEDEQRFRGAEAIMVEILIHPSESKRLNVFNPDENWKKPMVAQQQGLILTDKLSSVFSQLKRKKTVTSQRVFKQLSDVFDPKKGVIMDPQIISQQRTRYMLGLRGNQQRFFSINYNTFMMSFVLNQMYTLNQYGSFTKRENAQLVHHIVGTPGLGKSFKFIGAKLLHDLRIPHLLSVGKRIPSSPFAQQYKFFYITSTLPQDMIMANMYAEIEKDFRYSPPQYLATIDKVKKENFWSFIESTKSAYGQKNIRVRLIVDQINKFYSEGTVKQKSEILNNLRSLAYLLQRPVIMISSKNNPYLSYRNDPILYAANSSQNSPGHVKIIIDNEITITERLGYAVECLMFQLQKYGLSKGLTIKIVKQLTIPIISHLEITKIVKSFAGKHKNMISKANNLQEKILNEWRQEIQQQIYNSYTGKETFIKNINELIQKLKDQTSSIQQKNYSALIICGILSLNSKRASQKTVQSTLKVSNGTKQEEVKNKIEVTVRQIDQSNQNSLLHLVKDFNYFSTCKINGKRYMVISLPLIDALELRLCVSTFLTYELVTKLIKYVPDQSYQLFKDSIGMIFELYICSIYNRVKTSKWQINTFFDFGEYKVEHVMKDSTLGYVPGQSSSNYEIAGHQNPAYDLCLKSIKGQKALLILIDTTISDRTDYIRQKLFSVKNKLKKSQNFDTLINQWKNQIRIQQIDILYCVLMGKKGEPILYQENALEALKKDMDDQLSQLLKQKKEHERSFQEGKGKQENLEESNDNYEDLEDDKDKQQEQKNEKLLSTNMEEKSLKQINSNIRILQQHKTLLQKESSALEDLIKQSDGKIKSFQIRAGVFGQHMNIKDINGPQAGYKETVDALMSIHRQINKK